MCYLFLAFIEAVDVALLVVGIVALIRGKIALTRGLATEGGPARLTGVILTLPLLLGLSFRACSHALLTAEPSASLEQMQRLEVLREALDFVVIPGTFAVCLGAALLVVALNRTQQS